MTTADQTLPEPADVPSVPPVLPTSATTDPAAFSAPPVMATAVGPRPELVGRGLLFAAGAVPVGMVAAVLIWKLGFIASLSSFVIGGGATFLYAKGAESAPRRGLLPLVALIVVGVVASFYAVVAADLVEYAGTSDGRSLGYPSTLDLVTANLFDVDVLTSYGSDAVMFVVFAVVGVFSTVRRLLQARPRPTA